MTGNPKRPEDLFELAGDKKEKKTGSYDEWEMKQARKQKAVASGEKLKKIVEKKQAQNGVRS